MKTMGFHMDLSGVLIIKQAEERSSVMILTLMAKHHVAMFSERNLKIYDLMSIISLEEYGYETWK